MAIKYKPIKKGKALPRRKKKDIFPEKVSASKLKRQAAIGGLKGRIATRSLKGKNVGIGVSGELSKKEKKAERSLKKKARKGARAGRKAVRGMGPNVGIGVSGETKKTHAKAVKKSQRKRKFAAAAKRVKSAMAVPKRAGGKRAKQVRKIKKMQKAGMKVSRVKSVPLKETQPSGRIRKGAKKVLATKGGAYASYEKGSRASKGFQKAFKSGCAGGAKSFSWDGRSYSCKKK